MQRAKTDDLSVLRLNMISSSSETVKYIQIIYLTCLALMSALCGSTQVQHFDILSVAAVCCTSSLCLLTDCEPTPPPTVSERVNAAIVKSMKAIWLHLIGSVH